MRKLSLVAGLLLLAGEAQAAGNVDCALPDIHGKLHIEEYVRNGNLLSEHLIDLGKPVGWFGMDYRIVRDDEMHLVAVGNTTELDPAKFGAEVLLYNKQTGTAQLSTVDVGETGAITRFGTCKAH